MINQNCCLVQRDLYYYDIVSAFPTIMQNNNYDFGDVDLSNKEERNIFIGKQQATNTNLSKYLNESIKDLTDFYLQYNEIDDEDVIFRQKDGFILKKTLSNNDMYIEMKLRHMLSLLIIDTSRTMMIYFDENNQLYMNGIRYQYDKLSDIYNRFLELDFYNKSTLCLQLQSIKNSVINSDDKLLFGINGDDVQYTFILKNGKSIRTYDPDFVNIEDIDKNKYFNFYFKPFMDSIFMETFYE
jgi:hypothetical protein